jgi:hypothetical protein
MVIGSIPGIIMVGIIPGIMGCLAWPLPRPADIMGIGMGIPGIII